MVPGYLVPFRKFIRTPAGCVLIDKTIAIDTGSDPPGSNLFCGQSLRLRDACMRLRTRP